MVLDYQNKIKFYILHDYKKKTGPVPLSLIDSVIFFSIYLFWATVWCQGTIKKGIVQ